jgi:hypothetical protein
MFVEGRVDLIEKFTEFDRMHGRGKRSEAFDVTVEKSHIM